MTTVEPAEAIPPTPETTHSIDGGRKAVRGRFVWNLVDQVISSATSAILSLFVAHRLSEHGFGSYALAYGIYTFTIGLSVNAGTSALQVRYADKPVEQFRAAAGRAQGMVGAIGAGVGLLTVIVGLAIGGGVGRALICLGVGLPALVVVDAWRTVLKACGRPRGAAAVDALFAVGQATGLVLLLRADHLTAGTAILSWAAAALIAGLVGARLMRVWPKVRTAWSWARETRDLSGILVTEYVIVLGAVQVAQALIASIGGVAVTGALRGALVLLGPLNLLTFTAVGFAVPELVRLQSKDPARMRRAAVAISGALVLATFAWGTVLLLIPDHTGVLLLGETWDKAQKTLLPSIIGVAGQCAAVGPGSVTMVMNRPKIGLRLSTACAPLTIILGVIGVKLGGAEGAAWGLAAAQWAAIPAWYTIMARLR